LPVANDAPASIVRAADGSPPKIVFVPGLCSNAGAYLQSFPEAARRHGGVVAIDGDRPCAPGFRSFSWNAAKLDARIEAALEAAGAGDGSAITLVGYSQGAALAEQLVQERPERYARLVLIGAPTAPVATHFRAARGVVTMSCSRDVPRRMLDASRRISKSGVPSVYVEMPGCTHGNVADGDRAFDQAFDWFEDVGT
jgi:pimeloyl-ACP methyl ester carboxylesterase